MARFAPVAPPLMLMDLKRKGILGGYHLLLAHDIVKQPDLYREVFHDIKDSYIIIDNSTVELGYPVSTEVMVEAKKIVNAKITVYPDHIGDKDATLNAMKEVFHEWMTAGLGPFMIVPQGQSIEEITECARAQLNFPQVSAWGIPRKHTETLGTRANITREIMRINPYIDTHLLGFSENTFDDINTALIPNVKGIDSAVPIRLGLHGIKLTKVLTAHPARGDFFNDATEANDQAAENLALIREWISK